MYEETKTVAMAESPTPGELVDRLNRLRNEKRSWREAGEHLDKQISQAESEIQHAMTFLKDGLEGNPMNGAVASSTIR